MDIDYASVFAQTVYGKIGVKVWICKGEVLSKRDLNPNIIAGGTSKNEAVNSNFASGGDRRERDTKDNSRNRGDRNKSGGGITNKKRK